MTEPNPEILPDGLPAPRDLDAVHREWSATTPADPTAEHWMKPLAVGDVVGNTRVVRVERTDEELPSGRHYRHYARGHGKTALLAKLKALFGGKA
jgi:hypothetical protein